MAGEPLRWYDQLASIRAELNIWLVTNRRPGRILVALAVLSACHENTHTTAPPPPHAQVGPPAHVALVSGDGQSGPFGAMLAAPFIVKVTDSSGHDVSGVFVQFATTLGRVSPTTATTDSNGQASVTIVLPRTFPTTASYIASVGSLTPVTIHATSHAAVFATVSAGFNGECAATVEGYLYCWGDNAAGELGLPDSAAILTPQPLAASAQFVVVKQLALSGCGIDKSGGAWCWGNTQFGLLGDGESQVGGSPPVRVSGGLTFSEISVGYNDACGVTTTGAVYCWGLTQFGEGGPTNAANFNATPALVSTPAPFKHISASAVHTCGLATDGTAYCWGSDADGQLGTTASLANCGGTPCASSPVPVAGGLQFQSISAGLNSTCGVTTSGTGYCWGRNDLGQIGDGTQTNRAAPTPVASGSQSLAQITMADRMGCAVTTGSVIQCWGYGTQYVTPLVACPVPGSPGSFTSCQPTPTAVGTAGLAFSSVAVGSGQLCGIPSGSTRLYCWGSGYAGDLGDSSTTNTATPTLVSDQQ